MRNNISAADREYLENLYADTFRELDYFVNQYGLPYDVSDRRSKTSISNIGLYMADVAIAYQTGLLTLNQATQRLDLTFSSLESIEKTNGFPVTWINLYSFSSESILYPAHDHVGNLVACLLTVGGTLDEELLFSLFPAHKSCPYYNPGMKGGGLFMQFLPGIFLKERNLPMGVSAKNFASCQIQFAKITNFPAWGVSSSEAPSGTNYLGWEGLKLRVVTPHASVLAIEDFPDEVIENLKYLESKGVRSKFIEFGKTNEFGFTDSFDVLSDEVSTHYLSLDQSMLFLSLANFLYDEVVREKFDASDLGKKTNLKLKSLEPFIQSDKTNYVSKISSNPYWPYATKETAATNIGSMDILGGEIQNNADNK